MSPYDNFLWMITGHPDGVFAAVGWAMATLGGLLLIGGWLPLLVSWSQTSVTDPNRSASDDSSVLNVVSLLALTLGGGVILLVTIGTLSAYFLKDVFPGVLLSGLVGLVSTTRLLMNLRGRSLRMGTSRGVFAVVTVFAIAMTLWHHTVSEFEYSTPAGPALAFTDLNGDTSFHVYLAVMVREAGLPLRDMYGSPFRDYCPVTHIGHGVLIAGLASVWRISEYHASASLWVSASLLLCWSSVALMTRSRVSGKFVLAAGVIPLVFGPLMLPSIMPLFDPDAALVIGPGISNRMYWNLPQALSTALAAVGLVLFDEYCKRGTNGSGRLTMIGLVTMAIVASGWVKPSLFIFYAPGLLVSLFLQRSRLSDLAMTVGILVVGVIVYLLPAWLVTLPKVPSWSFYPNPEQTSEVAKFVGFGCGGVLLLALSPIKRLFRELVHPQEPRVLTLPLVAMGGSILFALLFREERFVGFMSFQPNIWWGPSACVLLLIPLLIRYAVSERQIEGWASVVSIAASLLMVLHVLNGLMFALASPAINLRVFPSFFAEAMIAAREQTSPDTRFLLEPRMCYVDLAGFLRRPTLYSTNYMFPEDAQVFDEWNQMFEKSDGSAGTGWTQYDAAIVAESSIRAHKALQSQGWQSQPLNSGFQLWKAPHQGGAEASVDDQRQ